VFIRPNNSRIGVTGIITQSSIINKMIAVVILIISWIAISPYLTAPFTTSSILYIFLYLRKYYMNNVVFKIFVLGLRPNTINNYFWKKKVE